MYTSIQRRKFTLARVQETRQRAQREFFPTLQAAPGFVGFSLVPDEANGINTAVDAFDLTLAHGWRQTLEELGNTLESDNSGETVIELQPQQ